MRFAFLAAPFLLASLAACGASEEAARHGFRQSSIDSCVGASRSAAPPQFARWDWQGICACATDRLMAGKSAAELAELRSDTPEQRAALRRCVSEVQGVDMPGAPGLPVAPVAPAQGNRASE